MGSIKEQPTEERMDSIKKKMEKLASETADAEARIAHFEDIKAANEVEAEKFEEQLKAVQKKIQAMERAYDVTIEDLFNQTVKLEEMQRNRRKDLLNPLLNLLGLVLELMGQLENELSWKMEFLQMKSPLIILTSN